MTRRVAIVPLKAEHLDAIGDPELAVFLNDYSWAALDEGGPVAAGGIYDLYWPGRGHAWFSARGDMDWRNWPEVTAAVKAAVDRALVSGRYRRVEMTCYAADEKAHRWAERLGFYREANCLKLMVDGSDGVVYVRTDDGSGCTKA